MLNMVKIGRSQYTIRFIPRLVQRIIDLPEKNEFIIYPPLDFYTHLINIIH